MSEKLTFTQKIIEGSIEKALTEHFFMDFVTLDFNWWREWPVNIKLIGIKNGKLENFWLSLKKSILNDFSEAGLMETIREAVVSSGISIDCIMKEKE